MRATFNRTDGTPFGIREVRPVGLQKLVAKQEIKRARKCLPGLPTLAVRWFAVNDPSETVGGFVSPNYPQTIWIRGGGHALRNSVTHECYHAWLRSIGVPASPAKEPEAFRFSDDHDGAPVVAHLNR